MEELEERIILYMLMAYKVRIAELEKENEKNKALIAMLEGFIDGKQLLRI